MRTFILIAATLALSACAAAPMPPPPEPAPPVPEPKPILTIEGAKAYCRGLGYKTSQVEYVNCVYDHAPGLGVILRATEGAGR